MNTAPRESVSPGLPELPPVNANAPRFMLELPIQYSGTVYVYCFDDNNPAKGIKTLYRQVDLLNQNGISAQIVHQRPGFRCTWFENQTSVTWWDQTNFTPNDTILLPEVLGANIPRILPGIPKVIFNQNAFLTFHQHSSPLVETRDSPYVHDDVIATLTVSEANANFLGYAFPKLPVFRMCYSIETEVFQYTAEKKRQVCYLPRQHPEDIDRLFNLLKYRGVLPDLALVSLADKTEAEMAAILQESLVFLNFGYPEGFGLLPAEAMACGCVVIGYDGIGGREFLTPEYGYPIAYGDLVSFATTIEQVLQLWDSDQVGERVSDRVGDRGMLRAIGKHAAMFIRSTYSTQQEETSTLTSWVDILRIRSGETLQDLASHPTQLDAPSEAPIEPFAPIDPERKLFIQNLLMAPTACAEVRAIEPSRYLNQIPGVRAVTSKKNAVLSKAEAGEEKVFVWQRAILTPDRALTQQRNLLERNYLTVAEIDEDPSRWPEIAQSDYFAYRSCHCVQTASEPLAELLRQYNPHVKVFANHLVDEPHPRSSAEYERATIFFGAIDRAADWKQIIEPLNRVIEETGNFVRVEVIHDRAFFDAIETSNKNFIPFAPYDVYLTILKRCTLAILPLADTARNRFKSDLKFIECGGHGLATLASQVVYGETILDGETGLIYRTPTEFERKFRQLVLDTELRQHLGDRSMAWVVKHRLLKDRARERAEWYLEMRDRLPELNADLEQRVPALFAPRLS